MNQQSVVEETTVIPFRNLRPGDYICDELGNKRYLVEAEDLKVISTVTNTLSQNRGGSIYGTSSEIAGSVVLLKSLNDGRSILIDRFTGQVVGEDNILLGKAFPRRIPVQFAK